MTVKGVGRRKKARPRAQATVHMVVDCGNSPGKVYAVFAYLCDAESFLALLDDEDVGNDEQVQCEIETRTLWYGQPNVRGYNQ